MSITVDPLFVHAYTRAIVELLFNHTEESYWLTVGHLFEDEMELLVAEEEMGAAFERSMRWHAGRL